MQGHPDAQFCLGMCYRDGEGVLQDYSEAAEWFSKAVNQGHSGAMINLGLMYLNGLGVPQNYPKAMELIAKGKTQN